MTQRFDILSRSESGLHYVREKRGGIMRVLSDDELAGFDDPKPCPECAEQFGCEHFNCAGEPMLTEAEIEAEVPKEWLAFARDYGVSRADLARFAQLEEHEGEWRVRPDVPNADLRTRELALLLNDSR